MLFLRWGFIRFSQCIFVLHNVYRAYMDNFTNPNSTIQGLMCCLAYKKGGLNKLKKLMSYEDTYIAIEKEFSIKRDGLNEYIRQQINVNKNGQ